jgi:hypothetical protein
VGLGPLEAEALLVESPLAMPRVRRRADPRLHFGARGLLAEAVQEMRAPLLHVGRTNESHAWTVDHEAGRS